MNLKVSISKQPTSTSAITVKKVRVRKKLFDKLFGPMRTLAVIVPGDFVENITICDIAKKDGEDIENGK